MAKNIIGNRLNPGKPVIKGRPEESPSFRERVYELVLRIPRGRVMSYGLVAQVLGAGYDARAIGNIMHATPDDGRNIPWHRVINAQGGCSTAGLTTPPDLQQRLLEAEGIVFNDKGRCDLKQYLWTPPEYDAASQADCLQGSLFS
ncbi:MAG TPA: MGMT family protein [Blastocatellia bacterium]|nr:MGMT family protein [Blastocatellia bacterium]